MATRSTAPVPAHEETFWLPRWLKSILFLAVVLTIAGIYSVFQYAYRSFPGDQFPRS